MNKLVYVGFAFKHHLNTYAGYHQIKSYINYDYYIDCQKEKNFIDKLIKRRNIFDRLYIRIFGSRLWFSELRCILYSLMHKNITFHFIYVENILKYLFLFKRNNIIVSTFHLPVELLSGNPTYKNSIKCSDSIILMSEKDVQLVKEIKGDNNVFYIPHGITTSFYKPLLGKRRNKNLLMVGNMLRNFQLANTLFNKLLDIDKTIEITIVTQKYNHKYFSIRKGITLLNDISNEDLLNLYQTASLLILPMYSFTANNALLEALSCGCHVHIISERIDNSYNVNDNITFTTNNIEESVNFIINYLENFKDNSDNIRKDIIENYSWEVVASKVLNLLR